MKVLMSKVQSGKNSGVAESVATQSSEGSDTVPNKSPSNTLERVQNKSPSNTLDRNQNKSPSNTLEKGKSPSTKLEKDPSFGAGDATKEKGDSKLKFFGVDFILKLNMSIVNTLLNVRV